MTEFWENAFTKMQVGWGTDPTASATRACDEFARAGVKDVLIPGVGYGRNALPFLRAGMSVTGIEISETAIALARSRLGLDIPIFHGSVTDMPFDQRCTTASTATGSSTFWMPTLATSSSETATGNWRRAAG